MIKNIMLQKLFSFLSLLLPSISLAQTATDTIYIVPPQNNHSIYIESNKASRLYNRILAFDFREDDPTYSSYLAYLQEKYEEPLPEQDLEDIPRQWCPLYLYEGNYYLYSPCDYYNQYLLSFTNNAVIDYTGEGPMPGRINLFRKEDGSTYVFSVDSWFAPERTLILHIVDRDKGIAVMEETVPDAPPLYMLIVSADKARNYPIIVNDCRYDGNDEFEFEQPDFEELLESR